MAYRGAQIIACVVRLANKEFSFRVPYLHSLYFPWSSTNNSECLRKLEEIYPFLFLAVGALLSFRVLRHSAVRRLVLNVKFYFICFLLLFPCHKTRLYLEKVTSFKLFGNYISRTYFWHNMNFHINCHTK